VRPEQPYNVAARALSALRDDEPYRNPRVVQDYGMESDEEANSKATPPQVSTVVCGSTTTLKEANLEAKTKCRRGCLTHRRCLFRPPLAKPRGKPDSAEALPFFYREQPRVES